MLKKRRFNSGTGTFAHTLVFSHILLFFSVQLLTLKPRYGRTFYSLRRSNLSLYFSLSPWLLLPDTGESHDDLKSDKAFQKCWNVAKPSRDLGLHWSHAKSSAPPATPSDPHSAFLSVGKKRNKTQHTKDLKERSERGFLWVFQRRKKSPLSTCYFLLLLVTLSVICETDHMVSAVGRKGTSSWHCWLADGITRTCTVPNCSLAAIMSSFNSYL